MREQIALFWLVPLRLYVGVALCRAGIAKLATRWLTEPKLASAVGGWLKDGKPYAFYAPFLKDVVLTHPKLFTVLVVSGEVLLGAALAIGLFTRPAAFLALALTLSFALGQGDVVSTGSAPAFAVACATLLFTAPGRVLGADQLLRGRVPRFLS